MYVYRQSSALSILNCIKILTSSHQSLMLLMINESINVNNLQIIDEIFLTQFNLSLNDIRFDQLLFLMFEDQKTVTQWQFIKAVWDKVTQSYDRLQWLQSVFSLWHFKFNYLQLLHDMHWVEAFTDQFTLWTTVNYLSWRDVITVKNFKQLKQLVIHSFQTCITELLILKI